VIAPSRITVVLSPPPTPNGPLHVGHLSGPYLGADVAVRATRRRGRPVLAVCGLDDHQNYVVTAARAAGQSPAQLRDGNADQIRRVFDQARIRYDLFVEPLPNVRYRSAVAELLAELTDSGTFPVRTWSQPACEPCGGTLHHAYLSGKCVSCGSSAGGGTCEGCGAFLTAGTLVDPCCTRCGQPASGEQTVRGPVLPLAEHRQALLEVWSHAQLPPRIRQLIDDTLAAGLPVVPLSYPTDWGIPAADGDGHRIDVWAEMAFGYLYSIGTWFDPSATGRAEYVAAWESVGELWAFLGIDNGFYYAIMFPAILLAAGIDARTVAGVVVNEFYQLAGQKFSTSRRHAIWADELLAQVGPELLRLFLCWDRPGAFASDFTMARFAEVTGSWPSPLDAAAAAADLVRAEQALTLANFAPDLAARCLLPAAGGPADGRAATRELIGLLTGRD
jgi:methionyl-tRNA synthetase